MNPTHLVLQISLVVALAPTVNGEESGAAATDNPDAVMAEADFATWKATGKLFDDHGKGTAKIPRTLQSLTTGPSLPNN